MYGFFFGWYLKCQSDTQTLAVIPAYHRTGRKRTCSIQIITDQETWMIPYKADEFRCVGKHISIGKNQFSEKGIRLSAHTAQVTVEGKLKFGSLLPLKYDIMGPFALVPFMECRHRVWSMGHLVNGTVSINGEKYLFKNARGYWEGDRGVSFPKKYIWTQCCFPGGSLMMAVADIPIMGIHFTGIIGVVIWMEREYRFATYLGARAERIQNKKVCIVQGNLELEARLIKAFSHPLKAPSQGDMVRIIHESAACRAFYRFRKKGRTIFSFQTDKASFEFEYPSCVS